MHIVKAYIEWSNEEESEEKESEKEIMITVFIVSWRCSLGSLIQKDGII